MAKRRSNQKSGNRNPKKMKSIPNVDLQDMDDEVDIFHKQRDKISLDMNDDSAESDDDEQPVFDYKGAGENDSEDESDDSDDEDDDSDDDDDKSIAKIARSQQYLKAKHGNLEDDILSDAEEDTEEQRTVWAKSKSMFYNADNTEFELRSSDEDSDLEEEEKEVIRLRKETAKNMNMEDFGLEDDEKAESDAEPTFEEIMVKDKDSSVPSKTKGIEDNAGITYEEVKKDLSSLSRDEQMDVVSSSAPELVGLLSELDDALKQLDQINPLVSRVKVKKDTTKKEELHYLEVKKLLLLAYSQTITFYLLLKSDGQPVRDHPVIARLVEIKSLLDKTKALDENLPSELEVLLAENEVDVAMESAEKNTAASNEHSSDPNDDKQPPAVEQKAPKSKTTETLKMEVQNAKLPEIKHKRHELVSSLSAKMLSAKAAFEEKLRQKGVFTTLESNTLKTKKNTLQKHNSQLETLDDFGDDDMDVDGNTRNLTNGLASTLTNKISQVLTTKGNKNKVSGDEDLPQREDLGERRRKHELRVLSRAGIDSTDGDIENDGENADVSVDELNDQQTAKLTSKNSKTLAIPAEPETVDGKRLINQQMEKNRGLTPHRKKLTKNPRKKYKLKHEKAKKRQGGQVRQVRKPEGPYGGESTGINAGVSRSVRFKG